jgi:hypothetical protein
MTSNWLTAPNAAVAFCIALEALRDEEGASVAILCDNPDTEVNYETCAVEVVAGFTNWNTKRFYGPTPLGAILEAAKAQALAR